MVEPKPDPNSIALSYNPLPAASANVPRPNIDYTHLNPVQQKFGVLGQKESQKMNTVWVTPDIMNGWTAGWYSIDTVANSYYSLTDEARAKVNAWSQVHQYGGSKTPVAEQNVQADFAKFIPQLYSFQSQWGSKIGITDYMRYTQFHGGYLNPDGTPKAGSGGAGGGGGGPSHTVSTQESVNLSNPENARSFLDSALGQHLGRKPTLEEYKTFKNALNADERRNPSETISVNDSSSGRSNTKTMSTGGTSSQQFADEYAAGQEGAAEYQVATKYLDVFQKAITGGASI